MASNDNKNICMKNVEWDPKAALDVYIYHHLKRRNMHETAEIFQKQANVDVDESDQIDLTFLYDWWEITYDIYSSRLLPGIVNNDDTSHQPQPEQQQQMPSADAQERK